MPLLALLLQRCEATLNRWITESSAARERLRALENRSMRVDIDNTSYRVRLSVEQQYVRLSGVDADAHADIVLRSGLIELLELLRADAPSDLTAGEVEFRGSLRIAEQFAQTLKLARPSLEDELAGWIGGLPARAVAQSGLSALERISAARQTLELDTAEYLQSEARVLPLPGEVAELLIAIERLRDDVDRLEQRIDRLHASSRR